MPIHLYTEIKYKIICKILYFEMALDSIDEKTALDSLQHTELTTDSIQEKYDRLSPTQQAQFMRQVAYNIVDSNYGDRISNFNLDETPKAGSVASGSFSTPKLGGKLLIIDYVIKDSGVVLTPRNLAVIDHSEDKYPAAIALGFSLAEKVGYSPLELYNYARTLKCDKGWACGGACLSKDKKNCHRALGNEHKTYVDFLKHHITKDIPLHKGHREEAEKLGIERLQDKLKEPRKSTKKETTLKDKFQVLSKKQQEKEKKLKDKKQDLLDEQERHLKEGIKYPEKQYIKKIDAEQEYSNHLRNSVDEKNQLIAEHFQGKTSSPIETKKHGMSDFENHSYVEHDGVKFHGQGEFNKDHPVIQTINNLLEKNQSLPENFSHATKNIHITSQKNKFDNHWAQEYDIPGFVSNATGGDGNIVSYIDRAQNTHTIYHEMGHNFAKQVYGHTTPPSDSLYFLAMKKDGKHFSNYGNVSPAEDFAETAAAYFNHDVDKKNLGIANNAKLKKESPERYKEFERLLKTGSEHQ